MISDTAIPNANGRQDQVPWVMARAKMANTPGPGVIEKMKIARKKASALSNDISFALYSKYNQGTCTFPASTGDSKLILLSQKALRY